MVINPQVGAAMVAGGASLLGSIGSIFNTRKYIKEQREENERTRQYNLNLAKQQNAWNIDQWNRENAFNDPAAVAARLEAAGFNRNLALGNMPMQSAASPTMSAGVSATPTDMTPLKDMPTIGSTVNDALQNGLLAAQIDKIKADTKGQNETNRILATEADIKELTKGNEIEINGQKLLGIKLANGLTDTQNKIATRQLDVIGEEIENLKVSREEAFARIASIDEETINKRLNNNAFETRLRLQCREVASRIGVNEAQARQMLVMLPYMMAESGARTALLSEQKFNVIADTLLKDKQSITEREKAVTEILRQKGLQLQNGALELDNDYKSTRNDWQQVHEFLGVTGEVFGIASKGADIYKTITATPSFQNYSEVTENFDNYGRTKGYTVKKRNYK